MGSFVRRWSFLVYFLFASTGMASVRDCQPCQEIVREIESLLAQVPRTDSSSWAPAPVTEIPEEPFLKRLSLKADYQQSVERLRQIKASLEKLESQVKERESDPNLTPQDRRQLEQTREIVLNQRLLFEELKAHLERVEAKFQELDQQLEAFEMRLSGFESREEDLSEDMRRLSANITAHAVDREDLAYPPVQELAEAGAALVRSKLFSLPRTELKMEDNDYRKLQVTANASGSVLGLLKAEGEGGVVYDVGLTTLVFIVGPGARPLLDREGKLNREAAGFCSVGRTYSLKGFGSARVSSGLDVYYVKTEVASKLEVGRSVTLGSKTYSGLMLLKKGASYQDLIGHCRQFVRTYVDQTNFTEEIESVTEVRSIPRQSCTSDVQCKGFVKSGWLKYSAVPQCMPSPQGTSLCEPRLVNRGGTCILEGERQFGRRLPCANGYTCNPETRHCEPDQVAQDILDSEGIKEIQNLGLASRSDKQRLCPPGLRLPSVTETHGLAKWLRLDLREKALLDTTDQKISADEWFYPSLAYQGGIATDTQWFYALGNDSLARASRATAVPSHLLCISRVDEDH